MAQAMTQCVSKKRMCKRSEYSRQQTVSSRIPIKCCQKDRSAQGLFKNIFTALNNCFVMVAYRASEAAAYVLKITIFCDNPRTSSAKLTKELYPYMRVALACGIICACSLTMYLGAVQETGKVEASREAAQTLERTKITLLHACETLVTADAVFDLDITGDAARKTGSFDTALDTFMPFIQSQKLIVDTMLGVITSYEKKDTGKILLWFDRDKWRQYRKNKKIIENSKSFLIGMQAELHIVYAAMLNYKKNYCQRGKASV